MYFKGQYESLLPAPTLEPGLNTKSDTDISIQHISIQRWVI